MSDTTITGRSGRRTLGRDRSSRSRSAAGGATGRASPMARSARPVRSSTRSVASAGEMPATTVSTIRGDVPARIISSNCSLPNRLRWTIFRRACYARPLLRDPRLAVKFSESRARRL